MHKSLPWWYLDCRIQGVTFSVIMYAYFIPTCKSKDDFSGESFSKVIDQSHSYICDLRV